MLGPPLGGCFWTSEGGTLRTLFGRHTVSSSDDRSQSILFARLSKQSCQQVDRLRGLKMHVFFGFTEARMVGQVPDPSRPWVGGSVVIGNQPISTIGLFLEIVLAL